jgi:hypothetical protein
MVTTVRDAVADMVVDAVVAAAVMAAEAREAEAREAEAREAGTRPMTAAASALHAARAAARTPIKPAIIQRRTARTG